MATKNHEYDRIAGEQEHILILPDGRNLAYAHNGPTASRTVVLFFTGLFSVGSAPRIPEPCREIRAHWIAPTLLGMGNTSTRDPTVPYHVCLARDIAALLQHLYPTNDFDTLYISGGSYGTVPAQMIYGANYDLFPAGRKIAGCLLIVGLSPVRYHDGYAKDLSWQGWLLFGPLTQLLPFHLLQWLFRIFVGRQLKDLNGAKDFLYKTAINRMDTNEKIAMECWLEKNRLTEDELVNEMAKGSMECCLNWDGFMELSDIIHSDWGFDPRQLDDQHASKPVLLVESTADQIGGSANSWLLKSYRSARLKEVPGGHSSALFHIDEIWKEFIESE
ncbi:uncharacterized protein N7469_011484 [Penicillium citrinum]|uniref:AB hydrolase-1 domain-containing protein n=2 Tax=Penicillium TaxID=5073 RepID=A0A9W9NDK2_PENCI|nr:uncharacterized protein N7469_011484 [Penicillium citrinum]KAJ5217859.1 hypothetical protein N7469_011484 [Penicillium citrinum]KAJ5575258.1 hypothetical protein N7450_009157 [Penicillium hetheringtonii]KAK5796504.1 hypothetical protein VI817_005789 [Penicillium citrinum]